MAAKVVAFAAAAAVAVGVHAAGSAVADGGSSTADSLDWSPRSSATDSY